MTLKTELGKKVGGISLADAFLIGAAKITSEQVISVIPVIGGNSTYKSGASKVVISLALNAISKKSIFKYAAMGTLIDGMEDIAINVKRSVQNYTGFSLGSQESGDKIIVM